LKTTLLYIGLLLPIFGSSQIATDAHLWTGIGVSAKINSKLSFGYETQARLYQNASTLRVYLNQVGTAYKITDNFKVGFDYRFSRKNKGNYFVSENRFMLNTSYGYKVKPINTKISVRLRYQNSFDRLKTINETITPNISNVFRAKVVAKYKQPNFKRIQPFIGAEIFKSLDASNHNYNVDAYRLIAGLNFDLPFKNELKLYYIYQKNFGNTLATRHIYSIQYNYDLSNLFK